MFSPRNLNGSRVILTGASSGIGHALALRLSAAGANLVVASRQQQRLEDLATRCRTTRADALVFPLPTDLTDPLQRQRLIQDGVAKLGGLDLLINNAGVGARGFFDQSDESRLRDILELNFIAVVELSRLALPHLRQGRAPGIVNIASILGRRAIPGCLEYCASKFALAGWSEGLRAELARDGIGVLLVNPGPVATEFSANLLARGQTIERGPRKKMTADRCAEWIVKAIRSNRNEITITLEAKLLLWANWLAPRLVDWYMGRMMKQAPRAQ